MRRSGFGPGSEGFEHYRKWRKRSDARIHEALARYATYCAGQLAGMGEALNVEAIRFACEADQLPKERWREVTQEMLLIHEVVMSLVDRPKASHG